MITRETPIGEGSARATCGGGDEVSGRCTKAVPDGALPGTRVAAGAVDAGPFRTGASLKGQAASDICPPGAGLPGAAESVDEDERAER